MSGSHLHFALPGSIGIRTGGYRYDKRVVEQLRLQGWEVTLHSLDDSFPTPTGAALDDAARRLSRIPDDSLVLVDGLAFGAMPEVAAALSTRVNLIALVHHPLALETGLTTIEQEDLRASEKAALSSADHVAKATGIAKAISISSATGRRHAGNSPARVRGKLMRCSYRAGAGLSIRGDARTGWHLAHPSGRRGPGGACHAVVRRCVALRRSSSPSRPGPSRRGAPAT